MAINRTQVFNILMCLSFSTLDHSVYSVRMMGVFWFHFNYGLAKVLTFIKDFF